MQVTALLGDGAGLDVDHELLTKDKSMCSTLELETIRRERNRMHAKKTRLRKKKMIQEMETVRRGARVRGSSLSRLPLSSRVSSLHRSSTSWNMR